MILNNSENISTLEWNLKYEKLMLEDGWKDLKRESPIDKQRVLVVGDWESDKNSKVEEHSRRISLCKFREEEKTFDVCDAEYYIPSIVNVRWWKPVTF